MQKRGAVELSFSTIVILVLAMTMLILGLVLIKGIFGGATYNVNQLNKQVEDQIKKLFQDDDTSRIVVYLADGVAPVKKGKSFGVAFGIRNIGTTGSAATEFTYAVSVQTAESDLRSKCQISTAQALGYISEGKTGSAAVAPNEINYQLIRVSIPVDGPVCLFRYKIEVKKAGQLYTSENFDVDIS